MNSYTKSKSNSDCWALADKNRLFGLPIWKTNLESVVDVVVRNACSHRPGYVVFANVYTTMLATSNMDYKAVFENASLVLPDGKPLVWALNSIDTSCENPGDRVSGTDAMSEIISIGLSKGMRHYWLGGHQGSSQILTTKLKVKYPGLIVAGSYEPPFRPLTKEEETSLIQNINDSKADIVWVGIGSPKQDFLMSKIFKSIHAPLLGVGAAFDFQTGKIKRAPNWMRNLGLEWAFRLCMEPRRLWKRYLWSNPRFLIKWLLMVLRR
jgi:N-acetylglucosaminyldiphosphoundecaprenol N-acetyl-beta-D-mannosaminyltransferase